MNTQSMSTEHTATPMNTPLPPATTSGRAEIIFKNVNVIPMTTEMVLHGYSVYVKNGKIEAVDRFEEFNLSSEAEIIEATGQYLLPGFSDMHMHFGPDDRVLYLANGVTLVRSMWGDPRLLASIREWKAEKTPHPEVYTTGPLIDGKDAYWPGSFFIEDPAQVAHALSQMQAEGYHAIKVYEKLTLPVYDEIIAVAHRLNMPVVGHVPYAVGLRHVIESGQLSIEHLRGYDFTEVDEQILADTVKSGLWNCPTLAVFHGQGNLDGIRNQPTDTVKYVTPADLSFWKQSKHSVPEATVREEILKKLFDHGARIVAGTDAGNPYVIGGFSLHGEFQYLNKVGLSPYQVLLTTTKNAAEMLGYGSRLGTIEVGKDADVVLLDKNPLEDIANTAFISGVMTKGVWLPRAQLQRMLAEVAQRNSETGNT